jgi:hypothetical protein
MFLLLQVMPQWQWLTSCLLATCGPPTTCCGFATSRCQIWVRVLYSFCIAQARSRGLFDQCNTHAAQHRVSRLEPVFGLSSICCSASRFFASGTYEDTDLHVQCTSGIVNWAITIHTVIHGVLPVLASLKTGGRQHV